MKLYGKTLMYGKRRGLACSCPVRWRYWLHFLGFTTAYTDYRYRFRLKPVYLAPILLPPTIPLIIMALAMLAWFAKIGIAGQISSIIIAHTVLTAPFAMAIIRLRLNQMDPSLEGRRGISVRINGGHCGK